MRKVRTISALLFACLALALPARGQVDEAGRVSHPPLGEMSGIARSATHAGVWWVHNDSGDRARLFAIDARGEVIVPEGVAAANWGGFPLVDGTNVDWEDIALDGGTFYIADLGNNGNRRQDLGIYLVEEPDPRRKASLWTKAFLPIVYPDQHEFPPEPLHFDCESIFVDGERVYVLTKHRTPIGGPEAGTKLYRLDTRHTDRPNVLVLVDRHPSIGLWPTAADLSSDGRRLAVLTLTEVWLFERPTEGDRWLSQEARRLRLPATTTQQAEAICFDDAETLRIASEQRGLFTLKTRACTDRVPYPE